MYLAMYGSFNYHHTNASVDKCFTTRAPDLAGNRESPAHLELREQKTVQNSIVAMTLITPLCLCLQWQIYLPLEQFWQSNCSYLRGLRMRFALFLE